MAAHHPTFSAVLQKRSQGRRSPFKAWASRLVSLEAPGGGSPARIVWRSKEGTPPSGELVLGTSSRVLDHASSPAAVASGCVQIEGEHRTLLLRGQPQPLSDLKRAVEAHVAALAGRATAAAPAPAGPRTAPAAREVAAAPAASHEALQSNAEELVAAPETAMPTSVVAQDAPATRTADATAAAAASAAEEEEMWARAERAEARAAEAEMRAAATAATETRVRDREASLASREAALAARETSVASREATVDKREATANKRESELAGRERRVETRELEAEMREEEVTAREDSMPATKEEVPATKEEVPATKEEVPATKEAVRASAQKAVPSSANTNPASEIPATEPPPTQVAATKAPPSEPSSLLPAAPAAAEPSPPPTETLIDFETDADSDPFAAEGGRGSLPAGAGTDAMGLELSVPAAGDDLLSDLTGPKAGQSKSGAGGSLGPQVKGEIGEIVGRYTSEEPWLGDPLINAGTPQYNDRLARARLRKPADDSGRTSTPPPAAGRLDKPHMFAVGARVMALAPEDSDESGGEDGGARGQWVPGRVLAARGAGEGLQFKVSLDGYDSETDSWVGAHDPSVRAMSGDGEESAKSDSRVASRMLSERRRADGRRELASREADSMST